MLLIPNPVRPVRPPPTKLTKMLDTARRQPEFRKLDVECECAMGKDGIQRLLENFYVFFEREGLMTSARQIAHASLIKFSTPEYAFLKMAESIGPGEAFKSMSLKFRDRLKAFDILLNILGDEVPALEFVSLAYSHKEKGPDYSVSCLLAMQTFGIDGGFAIAAELFKLKGLLAALKYGRRRFDCRVEGPVKRRIPPYAASHPKEVLELDEKQLSQLKFILHGSDEYYYVQGFHNLAVQTSSRPSLSLQATERIFGEGAVERNVSLTFRPPPSQPATAVA